MRLRQSAGPARGFLLAILLTACAGVVAIGAGCDAYAEMRLTLPYEAAARSDPEFVAWFNLLDVRMLEVCRP